MAGKLTGSESLKGVRWAVEDWAWLAEVAKSVGLSRSDFVRKAAMAAATATANGMAPYFVQCPPGTTQNTRIRIPGDNVTGKADAVDRRRRRGVAKGDDDEGKKNSKPKG